MRFRRVSEHVKDQNWFAVVLDFLIVVAGILIAFQITNWNEARRDRIEAETSRERLIADLRADLDAFAVRRQWYAEVLEAALRVDDALRSDPPETVDETWAFVRDSWIASTEWPFAPSAQVYKELQNAGDLDLIASGSMQRRLRDYYEDSASEIEISLTFKSAYTDLVRQLIEGRVGMHIADCLSADSLEPSSPGTAPDTFYKDCPPPEDFAFVMRSAASLRESAALRSRLNARLSNLSGLQSLLEYLDRQAASLVSDLEATQ